MSRDFRLYLEAQADRVEMTLAAHRLPGRVTGGTVGPRLVRFFLDPAPNVRFAALRSLADDLAIAMKVPSLRISRSRDGVVLEFPNPAPRPLTLLGLLDEVMPLPPETALLGLTEEGAPLLAKFSSPSVAHVLVAGTTGSGKSVLLRGMALSLILGQHPRDLRLLCIDPKGRTFGTLGDAPHLIRPPVREVHEAIEAVQSAVRLMEVRDRRGESRPHLIVMIDEVADLVMEGGKAMTYALTRLAQRGREAGVHLVAATQRPSAAVLDGVLRANFPLRLVGKVTSAMEARLASGRAGTEAHLLQGRGDFLAVGGGRPIRFQTAYVGAEEAKLAVREKWGR